MTSLYIELGMVVAGLLFTAVLFYRIPVLPEAVGAISEVPSISVIIPARNEERNLPLLLKDLLEQTIPIHEIICVDDESEDSTAQIALDHGVRLLRPSGRPDGWIGKSWACQNGANAATGSILLFLDADVRLGPDGIKELLSAYLKVGCTVSVQPYHKTIRMYEQFSMMFNMVQIAANGTALPKPRNIGLYGPVILIPQTVYRKAGGHERIRSSIVDDMALGEQIAGEGETFKLYVGNPEVSFRMYGGGLKSLLEGWIKNIATGATKTPLPLFVMVFLWITSLLSVPVQIIKYAIQGRESLLILYAVLYVVWVFILLFLTRRIGHFKVLASVFYPVLMIVLTGVFSVSAYKKLFGREVTWKGRSIRAKEGKCN